MNDVQKSYSTYSSLLQKHGITSYRIFKETGVPQSSLSEWKRGNSIPKYDKLSKIADYFGVSVDYLLTGEEQEKKPLTQDEELLELLDYYKNRPELKILFSVTKNAKPESIRRAAAIVEALEKDERNED